MSVEAKNNLEITNFNDIELGNFKNSPENNLKIDDFSD
jgi:hypothetical protein